MSTRAAAFVPVTIASDFDGLGDTLPVTRLRAIARAERIVTSRDGRLLDAAELREAIALGRAQRRAVA